MAVVSATQLFLLVSLAAAAGPRALVGTADTPLPPARIPHFNGTRYEADVPATLDLAERMKLSLNGLTRCVGGPPANPFPPTEHVCHHFILLDPWPKVIRSVVIYGKFMESSLLARMATGVETNLAVDEDWRRAWLAWSRINPVMHGPEGGRRLCWIAANLIREKDPAWAALGRRAVARLDEVAVPYGSGAWLPIGLQVTPPDAGCPSAETAAPSPQAVAEMRRADRRATCHGWTATYMAWTLQGLCRFYHASGDAETLALAGKLARYLEDSAEILTADGRFLVGHPHKTPVIHFHHCQITAQALLEYGMASGEQRFVDHAERVYRHLLTFCSPEIGFAPEYCYGQFPRQQSFDNTEACCSADLVLMALSLTEAGAGDYWDDVDRFIRNHIATLQLTSTQWFYDMQQNQAKGLRFPDPEVEKAIGPLTGNFGGWASVNEWHLPELGPGIMTCCISNCTRAFYFVHQSMLDYDDDRAELRVHLLLNRASRWADVLSYLPYEGKVEIQLKRRCRNVLVRAPEWIETGSDVLTCSVDGAERSVTWRGRYVDAGPADASAQVVVRFPVGLRSVATEIGRRRYTLTIKGNTVVRVEPPGQRIGLYRRERYLRNRADMVRVQRFVPDE